MRYINALKASLSLGEPSMDEDKQYERHQIRVNYENGKAFAGRAAGYRGTA